MAKEIKKDENIEEVQEVLSASGQWIEKNSNLIMGVLCAVIVVVFGFIALNKYVWEPKALEASNENAKAVVAFSAGIYEVALNGDEDEIMGFAAIADKYSHYQAGKLAALYAGICEYQLGEYAEAADYLKDFDADDVNIAPAAKMLLGDAYVELGEYGKAVKAFEAAAKSENELIAPMALKKAGVVYLKEGNAKAANKAFEQIKSDYPQSAEAQDIEKYIK